MRLMLLQEAGRVPTSWLPPSFLHQPSVSDPHATDKDARKDNGKCNAFNRKLLNYVRKTRRHRRQLHVSLGSHRCMASAQRGFQQENGNTTTNNVAIPNCIASSEH
jgi:hypothetical protein